MELSEFIRQYHVRTPNIMWFLGAGSSASANIPTADNMIWDFKRRLYCSAQGRPLATCQDLGDPVLRSRLQSFFDSTGTFPGLEAEDEYAAFFEAMYPDEADRRRYIEHRVAAGTPSFGQLALAVLMKLDLARVVWTTNFDRVVEDAISQVFGGVSRLRVATPDTPKIAVDALYESAGSLVVKLHGDFHSRRLKNTSEELKSQESLLERALIDSCRRHGLAVIGYSGRDESIMTALSSVAREPNPFPLGLYWFYRRDAPPSIRVQELIEGVKSAGANADFVMIETFDETMADLVSFVENMPPELHSKLQRSAARVTDVPVPRAGSAHPIIRTNALPLVSYPTVCRLFTCDLGGTHEVRQAATEVGADLVIGRRRVGVLSFGPDSEIKLSYSPHGLGGLDVHEIGSKQLLCDDSTEQGMVLEAFAEAAARELPVKAIRRRRRFLLVPDVERGRSEGAQQLMKAVKGELSGRTSPAGVTWSEAVGLRLEYRVGRLWLMLLPTIWIDDSSGDCDIEEGKAFRQRRLAGRYNRDTNAVLDAWVAILTRSAPETQLATFGMTDVEGIDALFTIGSMSGFSRRDMRGTGASS